MLFKNKELAFNSPKVMGILNVTPDSFSDGGHYTTVEKALSQARLMVQHGASFVDIGGESTRPGAAEVSLDEELSRVIPVIEAIKSDLDIVISIDTSKAGVMQAAVDAGAGMINDVRALQLPKALETASKLAKQQNIPTCIMHMQGSPKSMQIAPQYSSVIDDVIGFMKSRMDSLTKAGFLPSQIILDPGFGFGKTLEHNYQLLKHFKQFTQFEVPLMVGMSRKSMIGNVINKELDKRIFGDIAAVTLAAMSGASILRVHDVEQTIDAVKIVDKINSVN